MVVLPQEGQQDDQDVDTVAFGPEQADNKRSAKERGKNGSDLSAKASKVKNSVRVEVTNKSQKPVLLGDSVALRGHPKDECVGPGPAAVIQPGETLVDQRPGLLSPSMNVWVSVFTGEKACKWVEVRR